MSDTATAPPTWTIGALLNWTERYFRERSIEAPRLDAQVLLAHVLGCARAHLYTRFDEQPSVAVRDEFRDLIRRRAEGMPVAYLVGHKEFFLLSFNVTPDVLIPRPATETLVVAALQRAKGLGASRIIDLCCGSGCVGIAIAKNAPKANVLATDVSAIAVAMAERNANLHGLTDRMKFASGNLLESAPRGAAFDLIVSNPPYIPTGDMASLAPDVRNFEPRLALDGGPSGFDVIDRIIAQAAEYLKPIGNLLFEIGAGQAAAAKDRVNSAANLQFVETVTDRDGIARVIVARRV